MAKRLKLVLEFDLGDIDEFLEWEMIDNEISNIENWCETFEQADLLHDSFKPVEVIVKED